jgi:hypothetical protein
MLPLKEFPPSVIERLKYYVYLLIDPITNEIFYVGKGTGNRIFSHLTASLKSQDKSDKLNRIQAIQSENYQVKHFILRHGLTEKEALEVEAAVIDILGDEQLTNVVNGFDSEERGLMSVVDVISEYAAEGVDIQEPSLLIIVNKLYRLGMDIDEIYSITRGNWVLGKRRFSAKYAFAVYHGVVRGVFIIHDWEPVEARSKTQKTRVRWRFIGAYADELSHYVGGDVGHYITKGSQNPIRYINC